MSRSKTAIERTQEVEQAWQALQQALHPHLLTAPHLDWKRVHPQVIRYLSTDVIGTPWLNPLAFLVVLSTTHANLDHSTVKRRLYSLHTRWRIIFEHYGLAEFADFNPAIHLVQYLNDQTLKDSFETRQEFLRIYTASVRNQQLYLRSLLPGEDETYQQWVFPPLPVGLRQMLSRERELHEAETKRRKLEADAVTPHFARLRGEAHLRWNQFHRLKEKFQEAVALVVSGSVLLPVPFSYEETRQGGYLHFILWDRLSFVEAHADLYSRDILRETRQKAKDCSPEKRLFFLELLGSAPSSRPHEPLERDTLLWFGDLLRYGLLGSGPLSGTPEEVSRKQAYLRSWGYGPDAERTPFTTGISGLLVWPKEQGAEPFLAQAQRRAQGRLFLVEPLFAAATFGLAALDFFTTTGARMSELLQISLTSECLYTLNVEGSQRLLVRLIPKGTDRPAEYVVGPETRHNFEKVARVLQEHYHLQTGEPLPRVAFHIRNARAHQFPDHRPYLFQYNGLHFTHNALTACLRFLCHGMIFQTTEGKGVPLKAHTLRHVFATHIHQVEQVPLDVVAAILHQKDVQVTSYYAAPPWQQVLATTNSLLDRFATALGNIEEAFLRSPAELQKQFVEARLKVGTLAKVIGGDCSCHAVCPYSYVCTGCVYKIPDPTRREEVVEQKQWAMIRLEQVKRRGMGPETVKMQALIQRCDTELQEMNLIEEYRTDEIYQPELRIESTSETAKEATPLAGKTLRGETPAYRAPGQSEHRSTSQREPNSDH